MIKEFRFARFGDIEIEPKKKRTIFFAAHSKRSIVTASSGSDIAFDIFAKNLLHVYNVEHHSSR